MNPAISVFGIVCNILNLLVLTRGHMIESPFTYLTGLAVSDLSVLTLSFLQTTFSRAYNSSLVWSIYSAYIFLPVANIMANSSVWITVFLTCERYISVRYPLRTKELCTRTIARKTMSVVYVACTIINIPRFFCRRVELSDDKYIIKQTEFEQSSFYSGITWFYIFIIHIIPTITLICLNSCLLMKLRNAKRERNTLGFQNQREALFRREQRRLTVTCISIIILFIICIVPSAFSQKPVAFALFGKGMTLSEFSTSPFYRLLRVVTNTLVCLNFSMNFVLYCLFNARFVQTLKYIIWCCVHGFCYFNINYGKYTFRRLSNNSTNGSTALLPPTEHPPQPRSSSVRTASNRGANEDNPRKPLCRQCVSVMTQSSNQQNNGSIKHYVINFSDCNGTSDSSSQNGQ